MKHMLKLLTILAGVVFFNSCYYDHPPEPQPIDPETISFESHVIPILERSCSTVGCHDGSREPDLRSDVAYANIQATGLVNLTFPEESGLYKTVEFLPGIAPMPPNGIKIPEVDRQIILAWIYKGALND